MGSINGLDDAINKLTGGNNGNPENLWWFKVPRIGASAAPSLVAGRHQSLWQYSGNPCNGAVPGGTARNPTRTTDGALGQADATGGRTKYLTSFCAFCRIQANFFLYDRLADISGLSGTTITEQSITGLSVSRYTGAASVGNEIWLEIYTAIGASATTVKAKYTNQAGTTGQLTPLIAFGSAGDLEATRMIHLPLASGDTGVRSVESVTVTATTGTAGDFGVTIVRRIAACAMGLDGTMGVTNLLTGRPGPAAVADLACLSLIYCQRTTVASEVVSAFSFVEA